ncbi:MAG: hypothetical protein R3E76_09765 [Planctomycetota bacterium]
MAGLLVYQEDRAVRVAAVVDTPFVRLNPIGFHGVAGLFAGNRRFACSLKG